MSPGLVEWGNDVPVISPNATGCLYTRGDVVLVMPVGACVNWYRISSNRSNNSVTYLL